MVQGRARARQRFLPARFVKHFMLLRFDGHHVSYLVPLIALEARFQARRALVRAPNMVFLRFPHDVTKSFLQVRASAVSLVTMAPGPANRKAAPAAARQSCLIIRMHSKVYESIGFYRLPPSRAAVSRGTRDVPCCYDGIGTKACEAGAFLWQICGTVRS